MSEARGADRAVAAASPTARDRAADTAETPVETGEAGEPAEVVRYAEPARSYRSLLYTVLALAAGFGIDASLSAHGALTHLIGWVVLGAMLLAVQALIVYAARASHSLTVTDTDVRVGEATLPLDSIGGVAADRQSVWKRREDDVRPVLGWPGTRPRGMRTLLLRLTDGREVEVPTRRPERLTAVLGVGVSPDRDAPTIRAATDDDLPLLADIDERAEAVFRVAGYALPRLAFDLDAATDAAAVFVVADPPVGFAVVDVVDGGAHLAELAVLPGSMRRGLGSALVGAAAEWAREHGHRSITLLTYADVPWNGPFYARLGFRELPPTELAPELLARRSQQTALGLDAVGRRIAMRREL